MNPFSDSHAAHSPSDGYTPELTLNKNMENDISRQSSKESGESDYQNISFNNISKNLSFKNDNSFVSSPVTLTKNHSFKNDNTTLDSPMIIAKSYSFMNENTTVKSPVIITKSYSLKNDNSTGNSPVTPKSVHSLKSPMSKHQSLVISTTVQRKGTKRSTITSPTHESIANIVNTNPVDTLHSGNSPTIPITIRSIHGTPNLYNESRIKSGHSPKSYTPNSIKTELERHASNKSIHNIFNGTPGMSQLSNGDSPILDFKISNITMENIPSGIQTLERHYSSKSKYSTATLERVHSSGVKRTENVDSDTGISKSNSVRSPNVISKNSSISGKSPQPKSILKNAHSVNSTKLSSTTPDINKSQSIMKKKSKIHKSSINDINVSSVSQHSSVSRKSSTNVLRSNSSNSLGENVPTTPLRPPQLTVFGHGVATPPTPKSTRFPQDTKVLPPIELINLIPPDMFNSTDMKILNSMTLQRKHFHKRNKSMNATTIVNEQGEHRHYNDSGIESNIKRAKTYDHPLPVPPIHHQSIKSNSDSTNDINHASTSSSTTEALNKNSERVGRSKEKSTSDKKYRSKSLPRFKHNASGHVENSSSSKSASNNTLNLTNFEEDTREDFKFHRATGTTNKNSVFSILIEECRNMDFYIHHCND